jgi:hypothetical protein
MKISESNTLDSLAERSLKQQMLMVKMLRPLPMELETSSLETITKFNVNFRTLQQEIKITDKKLMQHLKTAAIPDRIIPLLDQRQSLQKEILLLLKHTIPRAGNVKALMASEIQSVKNGRKALSGYKILSEHQGRIVNRTS